MSTIRGALCILPVTVLRRELVSVCCPIPDLGHKVPHNPLLLRSFLLPFLSLLLLALLEVLKKITSLKTLRHQTFMKCVQLQKKVRTKNWIRHLA